MYRRPSELPGEDAVAAPSVFRGTRSVPLRPNDIAIASPRMPFVVAHGVFGARVVGGTLRVPRNLPNQGLNLRAQGSQCGGVGRLIGEVVAAGGIDCEVVEFF